ncbi:phytanoyl-CoA dioxygenase family protein [Halomonas kalidii]|uniref:Phytanoyl-CoA dioxygenase family protein n=1 Tax=Halomonas kalidii TaxID=3043293 RepID=A0ABT6VJI7_9GAMM|nr:phytanoyl-CoA dioxygenase family protein [Halomonas kalidii]MDI5934147.1 phytanoyl-CoA dioxygenase family protein [Halomonas kalidii]
MYNLMDVEKFDREIEEKGWVVFRDVLDGSFVDELREDCLKWIDLCTRYQIMNNINETGDGTAHQAVGGNDSIDKFLDMHIFHDYLLRFFDGKPYVLNACTPVGGFPNTNIYIHRVHRDVGIYIKGYWLRINMLVMLDDFTLENGATRVLSGAHLKEEKPTDKEFDDRCDTILGSCGSVALFNSYLWHRGGVNMTDRNRVALTLSFGRPFIKPQLDYARMLGEEYGRGLSALTRQVLGYNCRVPTSHDEWYRPVEDRLYQPGQG